MAAELLRERLPGHITYGVMRDGRIFFVDDRLQTTSWLHPRTGNPIQTGHQSSANLPNGWEKAVSPEGAIYYIDHNRGLTVFDHPVTGRGGQNAPASPGSPLESPNDKQIKRNSPSKLRPLKAPIAKRDENAMVTLKGWLYRQESGSWKTWKKRWCVLSNFGLFFYKDDKEQHTVGSILLPSYKIGPCPADSTKKFAFKAEHNNMKTYIFATDSSEDRERWIEALKCAAVLKNPPLNLKEPNNNSPPKLVPKSPFMTWDDDDDDEDASPRHPKFWQSDEIIIPGAKSPPIEQNGHVPNKYPHQDSPQHLSPGGRVPAGNNYQPQQDQGGHFVGYRTDQERERQQYGIQGNREQDRLVPPQNMYADQRQRNSYSSLANDSHLSRENDPYSRVQRSRNDPNPERHRQDGYKVKSQGGLDPRHVSPHSDFSNAAFDKQEGVSRPEDARLASNQVDPPYSYPVKNQVHRGERNSWIGDPRDSMARDPRDSMARASDRMYNDSLALDPRQEKLNRQKQLQNNPRYGTPWGPRDSQRSPGQDVKRRENNRTPQQRPKSEVYGDRQFSADRAKSFEGFYSPKAESRHRELSQRPLPEIKEPRNSMPVSFHQHHRDDTDDGYSTLTKYQDQKKLLEEEREKFHQSQLRDQPQGQALPQGHVPNWDHQQYFHDQEEMARQHPIRSSDAPHTYVNLPERHSAPDGPQQVRDRREETPDRPPLPVAMRHHFVEEIAEAKTPHSRSELLAAENSLQRRMQQQSYFTYPTPEAQVKPLPGEETYYQGKGQEPAPTYGPQHSTNVGRPKESQGRQQYNPNPRQWQTDRPGAGGPSTRGTGERGRQPPRGMQTVKEDPDMADRDVIETKEVPLMNKFSTPRLRMSICADDLLGKTHDELVLLLIQLRRDYSALEKEKEFFQNQLDRRRHLEHHYRRLLQESDGPFSPEIEQEHKDFMNIKFQYEEVQKKLEVTRPIVNLVHNMVNMGSLYGGDNYMLASQYRKHLLSPEEVTPPKKMLEFSRKHQEEKVMETMKKDIKELSKEEADLEEKIERLCDLHRVMQEQSYRVTSLDKDRELLNTALQGVLRKQDRCQDNRRELDKLIHQQRTLEKEMSRVLQNLAQASRDLEASTAENNKIEHEVALLRSKLAASMSRSKSAPSLSEETFLNKMKMEKDLAQVQNMMKGLSDQQQKLSQAMNTLRRSSAGAKLAQALISQGKSPEGMLPSSYMETDLDTLKSTDLSQVQEILKGYKRSPNHNLSPTVTVGSQAGPRPRQLPVTNVFQPDLEMNTLGDDDCPWDIGDADENTKRYFGLLPKEKQKSLTVRDVKQRAEQRRDKDRNRKDSEDGADLSSQIVQKEEYIPSHNTQYPDTTHGPVYENLPPVDNSQRKHWSSLLSKSNSSSAPNSRRTSLLNLNVMAPRPFVPYKSNSGANEPTSIYDKGESQIVSSVKLDTSPKSDPMDNSVVKATRVIIQPGSNQDDNSPSSPPLTYERQPLVKGGSPTITGLYSVKRTPRGRYMTISSSQPVKLETSILQPATLHSSAGDLITNKSIEMIPDIVRSTGITNNLHGDDIDREILFRPEKVLIPERYNPESDEEELTEEEKQQRREKAEKIKKLLAQQSVHSLSQPDVSKIAGEVHHKAEQEKVKRAHLLDLNQELARQVTLRTRQAAAERRKTWSGSTSKTYTNEDEDKLPFDLSPLEANPHEQYQESQYRERLFI